MKIKQRALSILLSLVMVLTFMPAMTFAEDGVDSYWTAEAVNEEVYLEGTDGATLAVSVEWDGYDEETAPDFYYEWYDPDDELIEQGPESVSIDVYEPGDYYCIVYNNNSDDDDSQTVSFTVYADDDYVTDIKFTPADGGSRFTFYEGATVKMEITDDDDNVIGYYDAYDYWFEEGDVIEVTYGSGKTEKITFSSDENEWFTETGAESLYWPEFYDDQETDPWDSIGVYNITLEYGDSADGIATTTIQASVVANPVSEIRFVKSTDSDEQRFTFYEGENYWFEWEYGDKIIATINGKDVTYVYTEGDEDDDFLDLNGNKPAYGDIEEDYDEREWNVGDNNFVTISYAGKECQQTIKILENPIESITVDPVVDTYSVAELIKHEWKEPDEDDDYDYEYWLPFFEGDKMTITTNDGATTEYTYKHLVVEGEEGEMYFVSEDGDRLDGYYLRSDPHYLNGSSRISAGTYSFSSEYKGVPYAVEITVTESTDEEITLEEARVDALYQLEEIYDDINFSAYRAAQKNELSVAFDNAYRAIETAGTEVAMTNAVNSFKSKVASVKTDAQLRQEEANARADEAARQGTQVKGMPKMKFKKNTAKKTSIKVQWAKLNKKQLKKSKATHYEIWVSANSTFPKGPQTKEYIVKKSKASVNVKGLSKNTKYFVRIRAIKYVGGKKMTGPWKQKTVKTKKK